MIFPEHFRFLTDPIFQFKFRCWLSGLLKRTIDLDIKVLNHILLTLASDHDYLKTKPWIQYFSLKINLLNQPIMKLACLVQHRRKNETKIVMKVRVLKLKCINFTMSGSLELLWLIYDSSNNTMYCDVCRKGGPDITSKTEFVNGNKKFKRECLVY